MKSTALKIFFVLAFVTFFVGDLTTTFIALDANPMNKENNPLLATIGFMGTIVAKILVFVIVYFFITQIEKWGYEKVGSFALGCLFMSGFLTIIINSGVFYR